MGYMGNKLQYDQSHLLSVGARGVEGITAKGFNSPEPHIGFRVYGPTAHMSCSLDSLNGVHRGFYGGVRS